MRAPILIDEPTFKDRLGRLIATQGDNERAGMSLEEVADMIYTRRMNINPIGDGELTTPKPKAKVEKTTGAKMDDLLG